MLKLFAASAVVVAISIGTHGQELAKPMWPGESAAVQTENTSSDEHVMMNAAQGNSEDVNHHSTELVLVESPLTTTQPSPVVARPKPLFTFGDVAENAAREKLFTTPEESNKAADSNPAPKTTSGNGTGFRWRSAVSQQLLFLAVQHGYAFTQPKTRRELKGPFFRDYFRSVASLNKWEDGGRFFTNHIAHPLQGAFTGFIQIQNDPRGRTQKFGRSKAYWRSRMKAMAWSAAWSTQFEIGPISQASIGNVGLKGKQTWVDIVITPTVGTALLVSEDALDRYAVRWIERRTNNFYAKIAGRMLLNPSRTCANLIRFKKPWYRDR